MQDTLNNTDTEQKQQLPFRYMKGRYGSFQYNGGDFIYAKEDVSAYGYMIVACVSIKNLVGNMYFLIGVFMALVCILITVFYQKYIYQFGKNIFNMIETLLKESSFSKKDIDTDAWIHNYNDLNLIVQDIRTVLSSETSEKVLRKQAELNALQSQVNPHFLYNTLESIRGLAIINKVEDIEIITKALADMFRYSISKKGSIISLREEMVNVDNYLKIQQFRFLNQFSIVKEIDPDTLDNKLPKLIIQPVVENAFKHGLEMKRGKGQIMIKAYNTDTKCIILIVDNGNGMNLEKLGELNDKMRGAENDNSISPDNKSIGLSNVNERIKMLYGAEYGIHIYSAINVGTTIELVLKREI
jgi:sensor histidine kinase YesM